MAANTTSRHEPVAAGLEKGSPGLAYSPHASATAASGAEKPTSKDTQPAKYPAAGCNVFARNKYSPPDSGKRRANAPQHNAPSIASTPPPSHATSLRTGL